jgi:hypothetical protein
MDTMKVFTLREAREILAKIKPLIEDINDKRNEIYEIYNSLEEQQDVLEKMYLRSRIGELERDIKKNLARVEELGGVIKGIDPILVDFLSYAGDRYIWLCWKEDEDTIMYWHELDDGFAGRKPIEILEETELM